jgi:hypothetical protein
MYTSHQNWSVLDDVLDRIVQHIDDKRDVMAFSIVQKSWRQAAIRKIYDRFVLTVPAHLFEHRKQYLHELENIMNTHRRGIYVDELVLKMKILQDDEITVKPMVESSSTSTTRSSNARPTSPKGLVQILRSLRKSSTNDEQTNMQAPATKPAPGPSMDIAIILLSIIHQCRYLRKLTLDFGKERFRMSLNADYLFRVMLQNRIGASTIKYLTIIDLPKLYLPHNAMAEWICSLHELKSFTASKVPSNFFTRDFQQRMARTAPPITIMTLKDITLWDNEADLVPNLWIPPTLQSLKLENCIELTQSTSILATVAFSCPELRELHLPVAQDKLTFMVRRSSTSSRASPGSPTRSTLESGICQILQHCPDLQVLDLAGNSGISDSVLLSIATLGENLKQLRLDDCRSVTGRNLEWRSSYQLEKMYMSGCNAIEPRFLATVLDFCPEAEIWA